MIQKYFKLVKKDPTTKFTRKVTEVVSEAYSSGVIDDDMRTVLTPNKPKPGRFYILPKLLFYLLPILFFVWFGFLYFLPYQELQKMRFKSVTHVCGILV